MIKNQTNPSGTYSLLPVLGLLACSVFVLLFSTGCRVVRTTAELPVRAVNTITPGQKKSNISDPVEMQQTLLRFSDEFSSRMVSAVEGLNDGTNALSAVNALRIKIAISTESVAIATGPNAYADLLDMVAFVTANRMALEQYWQPKYFGASADPMIEICKDAEAQIWRVASQTLDTNLQTQLRNAIDEWHSKNPTPGRIIGVRTLEVASKLQKSITPDSGTTGNIFGLLMLDPFAGMDPAVREIAQSRLLAERALYVAQKMPSILRWQAELLSLQATQNPDLQQIITNSTQITATLERFATVAEALPGQVREEREAILQSLQSQEKEVSSLLVEATAMSDSLNTTLTTFDGMLKMFGVGETNNPAPPDTNSQPFRIQDYTQTAAQLGATARQLTELINALNSTLTSTNLLALSDKLEPAVQRAETGGKAVVDYAFWKGVLLVGLALIAAMAYRLVANRRKSPSGE